MIYSSAQDWRDARHKMVLLFGMSGLGKTHVSKMLGASGDWFHYSVDYRIANHYLGKYIGSDVSSDNLEPLARYLGKPGDPAKGGIEFSEYMRRQKQHQEAEAAALLDTGKFIQRSRERTDCSHFVGDSGGSFCEVVDPDDPDDQVLGALSKNLLLVWIKGSDTHNDKLKKRFDAAPKPMCYRAGFMIDAWARYLSQNNVQPDDVDPDDFIRWAFSQALAQRQPRYAAMAKLGCDGDSRRGRKSHNTGCL